MTNNIAEYRALRGSLQWLVEHGHGGDEIDLRMDSQLVVNQVNGAWECRASNLQPYCRDCRAILLLLRRPASGGCPGREFCARRLDQPPVRQPRHPRSCSERMTDDPEKIRAWLRARIIELRNGRAPSQLNPETRAEIIRLRHLINRHKPCEMRAGVTGCSIQAGAQTSPYPGRNPYRRVSR